MITHYTILATPRAEPHTITATAFSGKTKRAVGRAPLDHKLSFKRVLLSIVDDFVDNELVGTEVWRQLFKTDRKRYDAIKSHMLKALHDYYRPHFVQSGRVEISRRELQDRLARAGMAMARA